jgi:hypothetical protein
LEKYVLLDIEMQALTLGNQNLERQRFRSRI